MECRWYFDFREATLAKRKQATGGITGGLFYSHYLGDAPSQSARNLVQRDRQTFDRTESDALLVLHVVGL